VSPEAIVTLVGLAFTVICSIALGAYHMGSHSNRIASLEDRQDKTEAKNETAVRDIGDLKTDFGKLGTRFDGLERTVSEGFATLSALITGKPTRTRTKAQG
jgi:hypothetical protein